MRIRRIGLRLIAVLLVLAATVPLALFAGALAIQSWRDQTLIAERQAVEMARAVSVSIDKEVESAIAALNVLGSVGVRETFDPERFQEMALRLLAKQPGWSGLMVLDSSGRILEDTADPLLQGLAESAGWLQTVARTRRAAVSDLHEDPATRRHFVVVAVPVMLGSDHFYVLAARISASRLSEILRLQDPPPNTMFTLIDGTGHIVARARDETQGVGKLASAEFVAAVKRSSEGSWRESLPDGKEAYASHSRSALTGWTVGITRPVDVVDAPIRRSIRALVTAGVSVLVVALVAALLFGQMIVRGVERTLNAAKALARGERIRPRTSRLAELDALWRGLLDAQAILDQRLAERDQADRERRLALAAERNARRASEKDQARLAVTLRSIGDAVIATDTEGRVTMLNEVAQKLTGWNEAEALEWPIEEVFRTIDEHTRAKCANPVSAVFADGGTVALADSTLLVARDGREIPIADSASAIRAPDGAPLGVVLVFRDVTAARAAERMRTALFEREQAARREAEALSHSKDEFVAIVSHELRTPLSAIYGWTRLLRRGALDGEARERALEVIERNTRAQTQLIDDLLDMSRVIRGSLRLETTTVELAAVLQAAVDAVRPAADAKQLGLEVRIDGGVMIRGDADRLQQVLCNVLNNAIKFSAPAGKIEAELTRDGSSAMIRVRDNGVGIARETLPHIFEPFRQGGSTAARARGGLGIGLALVRHLVRLHGGTIAAASDGEGTGATFTIRLPALPAAIEVAATRCSSSTTIRISANWWPSRCAKRALKFALLRRSPRHCAGSRPRRPMS
jgi:PAS domain S-box-containing protein